MTDPTSPLPGPPSWGQPPPNPQSQPPNPQSPPPADPSRPWYKRGWVIGLAAFFLGAFLGNTGDGDSQAAKQVTVTSIVEREVFTTTCVDLDSATERQVCEGVASGHAQELERVKREAKVTATTTKPPATTKPKPAPAPPITDGVYEVGLEIKAGTYKTTGDCYWARLADPDGDNILANHIGSGPMTLRVRPTDKFIELSGGCEWRKVG